MIFTYHVPDDLLETLQAGHLVKVPFRTGDESGIVVRLHDEVPKFYTKSITQILDPRPVVSEAQLALAEWMAHEFFSPLAPCLWLMLPPGITPRREVIYELLDAEAEGEDKLENKMISLLNRRGTLNNRQMTAALSNKRWRKVAEKMAEAGHFACHAHPSARLPYSQKPCAMQN